MEDLKSLIEKAQTGDLDAYGMIVRRFQDMAVGYAYSILGDFHLAEDAAQEAFIEAYPNLSKVYGPAAFPSWLRTIIFKYCDRLTRRKRVETVPLEAAINLPSKEKEPAEVVEEKEMKDNVLTAIASLPEKEREVTTLFYINGYSHQEIAEFLEVPVTTVNHRLRASRKRLKQRMITMVQDNLQENRPSKDGRYANKVQLFNAAETGNVDKVKELLTSDATRAALYDFLKARAEEQEMSVEELVVWLIERYKKETERREAERAAHRQEESELKVVPLLEGLDAEAAKQKAHQFFESLINKDFEKTNAIRGYGEGRYGLKYSPKLEESERYSKVVRLISISEPYQKAYPDGRRSHAGNTGTFVPFEIELTDGSVYKGFISMRCDNPEREWQFDGGL